MIIRYLDPSGKDPPQEFLGHAFCHLPEASPECLESPQGGSLNGLGL